MEFFLDAIPKSKRRIIKSIGGNPSERLLARLCDDVFLKLWAYPNPYKEPGKELCDVLVVFDNQVFIFSIKDISFSADKTPEVAWKRWKRKAIDESINQIQGAEKWIRKNPEKIFLDRQCKEKFPLAIDPKNCKIHRIVVAFGAEEACKNDSPNNINGSLAVAYATLEDSKKLSESMVPFDLILPRKEIIHVFDSYNLDIILNELNTVSDLLWYFEVKEEAIKEYKVLRHCGEEELLAMYLQNIDEKTQRHYIGVKDEKYDLIDLGDGFWGEFTDSNLYKRKKQADKNSYLWDGLIQKMSQYALDGNLTSNADIFKDETVLIQMAREPRAFRRELSDYLLKSFKKFPDDKNILGPYKSCFLSYNSDCMYLFFQMTPLPGSNYEKEYRPVRFKMLEIACAAVKNRFPHLNKIVGIAMEPPKHHSKGTEDFILLDCKNWTKKNADYYQKENKETGLNFFQKKDLGITKKKFYEFPPEQSHIIKKPIKTKPGRNDSCPCGSGIKFKKCCLGRGN